MMRHYCTLFDVNYISKGLAMYNSLKRHSSEEFSLHVLAMDEPALKLLNQMALKNVHVMPLPTFEVAMNLAKVKAGRTWQEYCWTAASQMVEYLLPWVSDGVTYLDADLFFFSDPKVMFEELGERSIAIIPHRLIPEKKHLEANGKFNVGWVTIQNTGVGRRCIAEWAAQCRERCSAEIGCGDQKYLDVWPEWYGLECCVIENIGANVAPWNLANWRVTDGPLLEVTHYRSTEREFIVGQGQGPHVDGVPVVFFHAHEFQDEDHLTNYVLRDEDLEHIYAPYIEAWQAANEHIAYHESEIIRLREEMAIQAERA
jgi:hypothetical protein